MSGRIAENGSDERFDDFVLAFDVDLDRAGAQIADAPADRKPACDPHDMVTETHALHASAQLDDLASKMFGYARISARAAFAAFMSIPLSPE